MKRFCLLSACVVIASPALAAAQTGTDPAAHTGTNAKAATHLEDDEQALPELLPPAKDTLGGHFLLGVGAIGVLPFGQLDDQHDFSDVAGPGLGLSADAGFGVSRSASVGLWFQYTAFGEADDCNNCDASSLGFGPYVRYHLVQGVRFDPWLALGAGLRRLEAKGPEGTTSYTGIDWLKLQIGGDWYALSQVGFGPFLELDLGSFLDRPADTKLRVHANALVGLRLALDFPGK